jgi:hypothetical protein
MATFVEVDKFSEDLSNGVHDLHGGTHTFKWMLTNSAPTASGTSVKADVTEITAANGYTAGGHSTTLSVGRSGQTTTVSGTQVVITATGAVGPFRYLVLYNDTPTSPADPVIGFLDHGSAVTMANTDTYTIPAGAIFTVN